MIPRPFRYLTGFAWLALLTAPGTRSEPVYTVRDLPGPEEALIEAGGLCHWPDGSLVVATRRGDIWTMREGQWTRFATGLMDPLGVWADTTGEVYVTQSAELTRIHDIDGDGVADRYETVTADWGIPGSKTDFVYGLERDKQGNFYGTMHTTHAPWAGGVKRSPNNFGGPMGAAMIGRGWSFQVTPTGELTWWSSGLRAPNGLGFNAAGALFATDNQGDWVGTSAMHHIERGDFHGHPSSYQWDPLRTLDLNLPLEQLAVELDKIRKPPAIQFPHGILGNSPSQPVLAPADGGFGPFAGQLFVGDNVAPLISRVFLEKINGVYQGACFPFIRDQGLNKALCRMTFSPDGRLVIGFGCRGWGPATDGLQEVVWSGATPFEIQSVRLLPDGFRLTFTKPLAEQQLADALSVQSYFYNYHHLYGSPITDRKQVPLSDLGLSSDRTEITVRATALEEGRIYEFKLTGLTSVDGVVLTNNEAWYTLNQLHPRPEDSWTFFPLCMDTHDAAKRSLEEQARLFRELGFAGCGHLCHDLGYGPISHPPDATLEDRAKTLAAEGLRLVHAYGRVYLQREQPIDLERIAEMMPTLAQHQSQLVLLLLGDRKAGLDDRAVEILGEIADITRPHGVPVVLYPHATDYTETVAEALRIVRKLSRPGEVGVMFNLSHWQPYDPNRDFRGVLTSAGPYLKAVSINGTNREHPAVLPLSEGDFDVNEVLDVLRELDYRGPVGLMCWAIRGDARDHLTASMAKWRTLTSHPSPAPGAATQLRLADNICEFETAHLKGRIGDGRFIGVNQLIHKPKGIRVSGDGRANRHGLLSLYRVFTRNHRYGDAAYGWPEREISVIDEAVVMRWPATEARPFDLLARYSFPKPNEVKLQVSVVAHVTLVDFEVQIASYFDGTFPKSEVPVAGGNLVSSPAQLGVWHAFPRDHRGIEVIGDGRWRQGASPVSFAMREPFGTPLIIRRHAGNRLAGVMRSTADDCFAMYSASDGEAHFSSYHALFGRTIPAGTAATAGLTLSLGDWSDEQILESDLEHR